TTIDGLRVERIAIDPAVFGEAAAFDLTGRAELGGAARDAAITLAAARIDGRDGHANLQFGQSGSPARLTLVASIEEPAGGLIARALALPGLPPVSLRLPRGGPAPGRRGAPPGGARSTPPDGQLPLGGATDAAVAARRAAA